jgi:regulatory protein
MPDLSDAHTAMTAPPSDRSEEERDLRSDPESVARLIALRLLDRQPRTRAELEQAIRRRGVPDDAAAAVLDRFTEVGLVDDAAFAAAWVDSRHAGRGLARRALAAELRRKGIADETVHAAVGTVSPEDEEATARALVAKKAPTLRRLPPEVQIRRLVSMLGRKGFNQGLALKLARDATTRTADAVDLVDSEPAS